MINMGLRFYKAIVYLVMSWLLTACNNQTCYHQFRHINELGWQLTDTLSFEVPLTDSLHSYLLTLQIRHTAHYPYKNIRIGLQAISPDSLIMKTEYYSVKLMNEEGFWISSGQGGFYHLNLGEMLLAHSISGAWHINIFQAIGDSILPGIHDLGIEVSTLPTGINTKENK